MNRLGAFEGDLSFDAAHDELGEVLGFIEQRIDDWASNRGFDAIDIPSMRADIDILVTLLEKYNSGYNLSPEKVELWAKKIEEPFVIEGRWGFVQWTDAAKTAYRNACRETLDRLRAHIEKQR